MTRKAPENFEIASLIERRGWALNDASPQKSGGKKTPYERAVEDLESPKIAKMGATLKDGSKKPKQMVARITAIQEHLDSRFASRNGGAGSLGYSASRAAATAAFVFWRTESMYIKSDISLITEQRTLATALLSHFKGSRQEMQKSYDLLEAYRLDMARELQGSAKKYVSLEKSLEHLQNDERTLKTSLETMSAAHDHYAEALRAAGNVRLERQRMVNEHEQAAYSIMNSKTGLEQIVDYQMTVGESEQVLGDACAALEQVASQQAIAQAVLSAFVKGGASVEEAYKVIEALSTNIVTAHSTIKGTFDKLDSLAVKLNTRRADANEATEGSRNLYGSLRASRAPQVKDVHAYVRDLFAEPVLGISGGNGRHPDQPGAEYGGG